MRRFNPEKELYKIQHGNKNKILYGIILLLLIISIGSTYAIYQVRYSKRIIYTKVAPSNNKDINILAVYIDNEPTTDFPTEDQNYIYDKIDCDNKNVSAYWDYNKWALVLETSKKTKCSVYFKTSTDKSGANPPELYQGLIPVTIDNTGTIKVADISKEWYNYDRKRWANAVLINASDTTIKNKYFNVDGSLKTDIYNTEIPISDILQMYVWIPRYKYQLFNAENGKSIEPQEIQIEFESNTISTGNTTCTISNKGVETCTNDKNGNWYTHPAFKFGDTDLSGIWVGKFETSGSDTALTIKPNITSWREINIQTMFNASRNIEETYSTNFNLDKDEIDTHMMKNMEWGAMAYLTQSKYGRCDGNGKCEEVAINSNDSFLTGYASQPWNTATGQLASTTGNLYGIYDINGGSWEYVMGVTIDTTNSDIYYSDSGFAKGFFTNKEKYYDLYEYGTSETDHKRGHLGDDTREILKTFGNKFGSWYDDYAYFPGGKDSWFIRGGMNSDDIHAGTFVFGMNPGVALSHHSFRVVLSSADK